MGYGLGQDEVAAAKTDKYIVDRLRAALQQLKQCRSKEECLDYHTVLAAVAPTREEKRDQQGMIVKVATRLNVRRGARYVKSTGEKRPYVFDQAITQRAVFYRVATYCGRLVAGAEALATSRSQPCTVIEIDYEADTCKLGFSAGGETVVRDFSCIFKGRDPPKTAAFPRDSARLRRTPPSLRPDQQRKTRSDEKAEGARSSVEELFNAEGARSPAQRDRVRRRVGTRLYQTEQALIVYATYSSLYSIFCARYPAHKIAFSTFKKLRPWYVRRAKEESCLCKHCDNFKQQQTTLSSLVQMFQPLLDASPSADADDTGDGDEESEMATWPGRTGLEKLLQFCSLKSKAEMVKFTLCPEAFEGPGKQECIDGKCSCGFKNMWSQGMRRHVVDSKGDLLRDAPVEFSSEVKWIRIKSSKTTVPGEAKQSSYESRRGTVVQFLDEFERESMRKFPQHRFTIQRQKAMDA